MNLAIGCDYTAFEMKKEIINHLAAQGHDVTDYGSYSAEVSNYPVYGEAVANAVAADKHELGILICGTGIGISLAANKVRGIRAAVCSEPYSAMMSRRHNNANIISFGARVIGNETAKMIVDAFISAEFESGGRHTERVEMINEIERRNTAG